MAIIKTNVPSFTGYRASVMFKNGVGKTNDSYLIEWFKAHGYVVETEEPKEVEKSVPLETMEFNELKSVAKNNGVFVGNTKDREKLISKLKEVM